MFLHNQMLHPQGHPPVLPLLSSGDTGPSLGAAARAPVPSGWEAAGWVGELSGVTRLLPASNWASGNSRLSTQALQCLHVQGEQENQQLLHTSGAAGLSISPGPALFLKRQGILAAAGGSPLPGSGETARLAQPSAAFCRRRTRQVEQDLPPHQLGFGTVRLGLGLCHGGEIPGSAQSQEGRTCPAHTNCPHQLPTARTNCPHQLPAPHPVCPSCSLRSGSLTLPGGCFCT